ncbi:aspartate kinase [Niameybacter massiliensis]|uniref:Aspartokinase n=1 Tax=Holtiella tumoricola TaxID=3018743 RepID=A0AA42DKA9_9FIRM|nr:aspartate kinase [Holtiella tumoricola]MDA3730419.1 aspartate kinase [Holtiella tumoricola]
MNIIVQKFGGTSVATPEARGQVIQKILKAKKEGKSPVVVVSAMGRVPSPYATDTLLQFVKDEAGEIKDREYDLLLSCGEIISAVTIATMLQAAGYDAVALTGGQSGIITDGVHKSADLLYGKSDALVGYVEKDIIPVVAGFQGMTVEGEITTLGRGGSDTTAAMLGGLVGAESIEIYTDVDGIMTADPRVSECASIIPAITYNEIFQMADSGAKVIHPRAVEYAMRANIPLIIKNTFSDEPGTAIVQSVKKSYPSQTVKLITGVAHRLNRIQFKITEKLDADCDLLECMAKEHISIDLINIFPEYNVFTIDGEDKNKLEAILKKDGYEYTMVEDCCKVTVIGERMTGVPGVMSRIMKALNKEGIQVLQTADSLTTIGCLIRSEQVSRAVTALLLEFNI